MGSTSDVRFSPSSRLIELMIAFPGIRLSASSTTSASVESTRIGAGTRVAIRSRIDVMYSFSSSPTMAQHRSSMCEPSLTRSTLRPPASYLSSLAQCLRPHLRPPSDVLALSRNNHRLHELHSPEQNAGEIARVPPGLICKLHVRL